MSEPGRAVFLSYASQDKEAVAKICDALRATGVEVWFDQSELRGGDAWDAQIRKRIKECALFVPVISAHTQARAEGYFRLEWKLAVDRSHLMADDAAFLFPVVIDDVPDATARVPDKFRDVQWTRLRLDETPTELAARVAKLLSGGAKATEQPRSARRDEGKPDKPAWLRYAWSVVGLVIAAYYGLHPIWRSFRSEDAGSSGTKPPAAVQPAIPPAPVASMSEARQLAEKARAMSFDKYDSTADDFAAADGLLKHALELDPNDAEIWAASSQLNKQFQSRGFDRSAARVTAGLSQAQRAVKLDPDSIEAQFALGYAERGTDPVAAEQIMRKILARQPDHPGALFAMNNLVYRQGKVDESLGYLDKVGVQPKWAALAGYLKYLNYFSRARFAEADQAVRQSIAVQPSANSEAGLAMVLLTWKGDADGAARVFAEAPTVMRNEPRTVWMTAQVQLCRRAPDEALNALDRILDEYIQDSWLSAPKAYYAGRAQALAGRPEAARVAWEAGLAIMQVRLKEAPANPGLHLVNGELLALLGRADEALREARTVAELSRVPKLPWFASPVRIYAELGRADDALPLLAGLCPPKAGDDVGWPLTPALLRLDPLWDKIRDDPRFQKLCAEPAGGDTKASAAPLSEGAQLAAKALALIVKVGFTRDDLAVAEDFARRATEKEPDSAVVWGVRAGIQSAWLFRNWDNSEKRRQDTQVFANRALALDPNEPEALLALGHLLRQQGAFDQAEVLLRRAVAANPDHLRLVRALAYTLSYDPGHEAEGLALQLGILKRTPNDPLLRYETAMNYCNYGGGGAAPQNLTDGIAQLDAAIAIQPFSSALILKAALLGGWRGDLPAMRAVLDQADKLPIAERAEDRSVYIAMWAGLMEHRPDRVEAAAALTARNYMEDSVMPLHPKAWWLALAHQLAGKINSARHDWSEAEAVLRQRIKEDPANERYQVELATTLAWLDQREEAARLVAAIEPGWKENVGNWWQSGALARYYAALGDAKQAVPYLAPVIDGSPFLSRKVIPLDPWWDKIRGAPEFVALLKEPEVGK